MIGILIISLENFQRHVPAGLVQELDSDQVVVTFAVRGQVGDDAQRMVDVLLARVPAERSLAAAVVPAVLAAGHAVQVEQARRSREFFAV